MLIQFDNKLVSSFLLFLDNQVQSKGSAFTNYSGNLYPVASPYQGLYAYATPFKQLCNDISVSGANIMSGVYLNGVFTSIGQSGFYSINHKQGVAYFTSQLSSSTSVSGRYAIKDFNIELADQVEYKLLYETKYVTNSKFNQTLSGLPLDTKTAPAIFLRVKNMENKPFAFDGLDDNEMKLRAIIITDNEFQRIGVCNILKNLKFKGFSIVNSTPFDYLGNFTGVNYNYSGLTYETGYSPLIMEAKVIDVPRVGEFENFGRGTAMVDFTISTCMRHP